MKIKVGTIDKKNVKSMDNFLIKFYKHIKKQKLNPNFVVGSPISIFMKDSKDNFYIDILRNYSGDVWVSNSKSRDPNAKKLLPLGKKFYSKIVRAWLKYEENGKSFESINLKDYVSK